MFRERECGLVGPEKCQAMMTDGEMIFETRKLGPGEFRGQIPIDEADFLAAGDRLLMAASDLRPFVLAR